MTSDKGSRNQFKPEDISKMTPDIKGVLADKLGKIIEEVLDNPEA